MTNLPDPLPVQPKELVEEVRKQRHDFILQYYQMAVRDLERHLGIGWQTIATVVGAVASLSLAEQGHLPVPIAVSAAFGVFYWGMLNLIDANYWAVRAIAFLANVEAVYFTEADRRIFNPYAGYHPPSKLLGSLRFQFYAIVVVTILTFAYFIDEVYERTYQFRLLKLSVADATLWDCLFWALPIAVLFWGLAHVVRAHAARVAGYRAFVEESPGPGMLKDNRLVRAVDFATSLPPGFVTPGSELQQKLLTSMTTKNKQWDRVSKGVTVLLYVVIVVAGLVIAFRRQLFGVHRDAGVSPGIVLPAVQPAPTATDTLQRSRDPSKARAKSP